MHSRDVSLATRRRGDRACPAGDSEDGSLVPHPARSSAGRRPGGAGDRAVDPGGTAGRRWWNWSADEFASTAQPAKPQTLSILPAGTAPTAAAKWWTQSPMENARASGLPRGWGRPLPQPKPTLATTFCGIPCLNPFWLAWAPPTNCGEQIMRAFDAGWGGAVWKTIGEPITNVSSRYSSIDWEGRSMMGFNNIELISRPPHRSEPAGDGAK